MQGRGLLVLLGAMAVTSVACADAGAPPRADDMAMAPDRSEVDESGHERAPASAQPTTPAAASEDDLPARGAASALPTRPVRIELISAQIGPGTASGLQWDSNNRVPTDLFAELREILDRPTLNWKVALTEFAAKAVIATVEPPDPRGAAWLDRGAGEGWGEQLTLSSDYENTLTPNWRVGTAWSHVMLNERTLVHVTLEDADVYYHDPITAVRLNVADLEEAIAARGKVVQVPVAKQSLGEILFLGIAVIPE